MAGPSGMRAVTAAQMAASPCCVSASNKIPQVRTYVPLGTTTNYMEIPTVFRSGTLDIKIKGEVSLQLGVKGEKSGWRYMTFLCLLSYRVSPLL